MIEILGEVCMIFGYSVLAAGAIGTGPVSPYIIAGAVTIIYMII